MTTPTVGVLFSGMGGFSSGLQSAGLDVVWANDNDPHACDAFGHRFPNVELFRKDVSRLHVTTDKLASVDVLAAAFPCQSFSQAGDRRGFDDPRGALFFEIPRLVQEWSDDERPKLIILENVPHLRYGAGGAWFDRVRKELRTAGYWFRESACWTVNVKDATGLPQDRERLFMVAASRAHFSYNPFSPPSGQPSSTQALDELINRADQGDDAAYLRPDNRYYEMIRREIETGESSRNIYQLRRSYVREKRGGLCPTLTANMGLGGHNVPFILDEWGIRRLSVEEVAALQGFSGTEFPASIPEPERYRLLGNAVCVKLAEIAGKACLAALEERLSGD